MHRLRNVEPAVYNQRRLGELPLPSHQNDHSPADSSDNDSFVNDHENNDVNNISDADDIQHNEAVDSASSADLSIDAADISNNGESAIETTDNDESNGIDSNTNEIDPLAIESSLVPKTEPSAGVPLFNIHVGNRAEIEELLNEPEDDDDDDDVIMIIGSSGIPRPWSTTSDDLIKRENDKMTGAIAFNQTVSIFIERNI